MERLEEQEEQEGNGKNQKDQKEGPILMKSTPSTMMLALSAIAALWLLGMPARAAAQADDADDTAGLPTLPENDVAQKDVAQNDLAAETVRDDRILEVFQIESADATELARVVSEFLRARAALGGPGARRSPPPGAGRGQSPRAVAAFSRGTSEPLMTADRRTNKLIVETTGEQDLEVVRRLIRELDVPVRPIDLKTHIYHVKYSRADDVASVLHNLLHTSPSPPTRSGRTGSRSGAPSRSPTVSPPASLPVTGALQSVGPAPLVVPYLPTNCLLIQAEAEGYKEILDILGEIDAERRQILLELAIVEVKSDSGLNYAIGVFAGEPDAERSRVRRSGASEPGHSDPGSLVPEALLAILQKGDFPELVEFLNGSADCRVLARPFLMADENKENHVDITETRYVQNTTVQSNQTILSSQQGEDAGITLSVVPTISASQKTILLELDLSLSEFTGTATAPNVLPPKILRRLTSSVTVPDGQILAIGRLTPAGGSQAEAVDANHLYVLLRTRIVTARAGR